MNEGLTVYSQLKKDEEVILIPFAISQYGTVCLINGLLPEYLADLERNECKESLCIDFDQMTSVDYWMEKLAKLRSDMERLGTVPMKEHGIVVTILDFTPETTMDLYRAIEQEIMRMVEMLKQVEVKLLKAPVALYGNFYRYLRAQYCEEQAMNDFKNWMRSSGIATLEKYKTFRAEQVIRFIKGTTLDCAGGPSEEEKEKVDVERFKKQVPLSYQEEKWFVKCFDKRYVIFSRTVRWEGDFLVPDYSCAGLFIFQHWNSLSEDDIKAIFYLDKMLELIHAKMKPLSGKSDVTVLPEILATPEAMRLWKKAQRAGYVDEHFQPICSRSEAALLADVMAERLNITEKWKIFEAFWNRNNMRSDFSRAVTQPRTLEFQDKIKRLFCSI